MIIYFKRETNGVSIKEGSGPKYSIIAPLKRIQNTTKGFTLIFEAPQPDLTFDIVSNTPNINGVDSSGLSIEAASDKVRDEVFRKAGGAALSLTSITVKADDTAAFAELNNGQSADFEVGGIISRYSKNAAGTTFKHYNQYP